MIFRKPNFLLSEKEREAEKRAAMEIVWDFQDIYKPFDQEINASSVGVLLSELESLQSDLQNGANPRKAITVLNRTIGRYNEKGHGSLTGYHLVRIL